MSANLIKHLVIATVLAASVAQAEAPSAANFADSRFLTVSDIPSHLADWIYNEQVVNLRFSGSIFAPLDHTHLDKRFDPMNRSVVQIGYLEIPRDKASIRVDESSLSPSARRVLFFQRGGVEYVRLFVHPMMEEKYADEAKLYGEKYVDADGKTRTRLKYGEFAATLSSSMRSWIIWSRANPSDYIGEKTSIAVEIGNLDRKNDLDKLARAQAITQVTKEIPAQAKRTHGFDLLLEPVTQSTAGMPGGKHYGNITRVLPSMSHPNGKARYVPGFALHSPGPNGETPRLAQLIAASKMPAEEFIKKMIIEPLVGSYAYLTFKHGIIGEPHLQNVLFELSDKGELTGRVLFRDLDAFKPDIELRHLRGLSDEPFLQSNRPYKLMKMAKAEHDYRRSYISYVKGAWTEAIQDMVSQSSWWRRLRLGSTSNLPELFDKVYLTELVRHFGFTAVFDAANMVASEEVERLELARENKDRSFSEAELAQARLDLRQSNLDLFINTHRQRLATLLPSVNLNHRPLDLSIDEAKKIIESFTVNEMFARNYRNDATTYLFDVNRMVEKFKALHPQQAQPNVSQSVLRREYERLAFNYRASTTQETPKSGYFVLNRGSITAFSSSGNPIGHAFLEPREAVSATSPFYAGSKYPRVEPNRAVLAKLYEFADGKSNSIPDIDTLRYQYPASEEVLKVGGAATRTCSALFSAAN